MGLLSMIVDISLDQIREDDRYNFETIFDNEDNGSQDEIESPYELFDSKCIYHEPEDFLDLTKDFGSSNSYFHLNCRSLTANWESFKELINNLNNDTFSYDIIGTSEIFNCDKDNRLNLPGYQKLITRTRKSSNRGGVGFFIKENINFKIRENLSVFIPHVYESVFIEIISDSNIASKQIIGVIYRPNVPRQADLDIFTKTMFDTIDLINSEKCHCIIMGVMNIDLQCSCQD